MAGRSSHLDGPAAIISPMIRWRTSPSVRLSGRQRQRVAITTNFKQPSSFVSNFWLVPMNVRCCGPRGEPFFLIIVVFSFFSPTHTLTRVTQLTPSSFASSSSSSSPSGPLSPLIFSGNRRCCCRYLLLPFKIVRRRLIRNSLLPMPYIHLLTRPPHFMWKNKINCKYSAAVRC